MNETQNAFASGNYFERFKANTSKNPFHHQRLLGRDYRIAFDLINWKVEEAGWKQPLKQENPRVLQIGCAVYETAEKFIEVIKNEAPTAQIFIADISFYPLQDCVKNNLTEENGVHLLQADTKKLPFADNSFDLIETDALLQFLPPEEKRNALKEWFRVLRPGGTVMTRDWLLPDNPTGKDIEKYNLRSLSLHNRTGIYPHSATKKELFDMFGEVGFSRMFVRMRQDGLNYLKNDIVAQKPEA